MILDEFLEKCKQKPKKVVYPEGEDERLIEAASYCSLNRIANPILIGDKKIIQKKASNLGLSLEGVEIVEISDFDSSKELYDIINAHKKRIDHNQAQKLSKNPLYIGALLVRKSQADICIGGAINDTADVIKAALYVIGLKENTNLLSSFFLMELPVAEFGEKGVLFFADCGVNPEPDPAQLADIAITTADNFRNLMGKEPKVAMLSFSTKGSAKHKMIDKVVQAYLIAKEKRPDLNIDGELQADAALVESVAQRKAPDSPIKGHANVLIFPDLNAGNIAYKLVERLAKAQAIGPIMQGLKKPMHDLSRGCKFMDIVYLSAISSFQL